MSETNLKDHVRLICAEYREMPGLKLTARQAARFWHLGPRESEDLLNTLVHRGVLLRTTDGHYVARGGSHG